MSSKKSSRSQRSIAWQRRDNNWQQLTTIILNWMTSTTDDNPSTTAAQHQSKQKLLSWHDSNATTTVSGSAFFLFSSTVTGSCTRLLSIYHISVWISCLHCTLDRVGHSLCGFFHQGFDILSLGKWRHGGSTKLNYWVSAETKHIKQGKTKSTNNWSQRHWQPVGATSSCQRRFCPAGTRACSLVDCSQE